MIKDFADLLLLFCYSQITIHNLYNGSLKLNAHAKYEMLTIKGFVNDTHKKTVRFRTVCVLI